LAEEADDWWVSLLPILEQDGAEVTWAVFRREFLDRYFPEDVRGKKEIEFNHNSTTIPTTPTTHNHEFNHNSTTQHHNSSI